MKRGLREWMIAARDEAEKLGAQIGEPFPGGKHVRVRLTFAGRHRTATVSLTPRSGGGSVIADWARQDVRRMVRSMAEAAE